MKTAPDFSVDIMRELGMASVERHAERLRAADKLDAAIDTAQIGLKAYARGVELPASGVRAAELIRAADLAIGSAQLARDRIQSENDRSQFASDPEQSGAYVRGEFMTAAEERQSELITNIYDGEPEFLIEAMRADVVVARTVLAIVNAAQKTASNSCLPSQYNLGDKITHAIAEYVERTV